MQSLTRRQLLTGAAVGLAGLAMLGAAGSATAIAAELQFVLYKDNGGKFRWRLVSANGKTIATPGQGYASKQSCLNSIDVIRQGAAGATLDDRTKA